MGLGRESINFQNGIIVGIDRFDILVSFFDRIAGGDPEGTDHLRGRKSAGRKRGEFLSDFFDAGIEIDILIFRPG